MRIIIVLIFAFCLFCCSPETARQTEISFKIDDSLLAEPLHSSVSNLSFQPPLGWESLNAEMMDFIHDSLTVFPNFPDLNIRLQNVFFQQEKTLACFLWAFDSDLLPADIIGSFIAEFKTANPDIKINEGSFAHNQIDFKQLSYVNNNYVNVKLIAAINKRHVFMLDYVVPARCYEEELPSIESSIGSIKKLKKGDAK